MVVLDIAEYYALVKRLDVPYDQPEKVLPPLEQECGEGARLTEEGEIEVGEALYDLLAAKGWLGASERALQKRFGPDARGVADILTIAANLEQMRALLDGHNSE